jgi:hypothetical protein
MRHDAHSCSENIFKAINGNTIDLDDNQALVAHFERPTTTLGQEAFPQAGLVSLVAIGTNTTVNAIRWQCASDQHAGTSVFPLACSTDGVLL